MKILIVGGMGIIGGAITEAACKMKHDVVVLSRRPLSPYYQDLGAKGIQGNWKDDAFVASILSDNYDVIVDTLVVREDEIIRDTRLINGHCKQYFYISSDAVYLHPDSDVREDVDIDLSSLKWDYGRKKREAELYLLENGDKFSFDWTVIRPTMTYGDKRIPVGFGSRKNEWTLIKRIIDRKPIINFDGDLPHAMCHSTTFGMAVVSLFMNESSYEQFYHISDNKSVSYRDVYEIIGNCVGASPIIVNGDVSLLKRINLSKYVEMFYDKIPGFTLNNQKIKSIAPEVDYDIDLKKAIESEVQYLRENCSSKDEDEEFNLVTDSMLLSYGKMKINSDESKIINDYNATLSQTYINILKKYMIKARMKNVARPFYRFAFKAIRRVKM